MAQVVSAGGVFKADVFNRNQSITLQEEDLHVHKKGRAVQNYSLLSKMVIDSTAFKYDYWFVLTGETFMRN